MKKIKQYKDMDKHDQMVIDHLLRLMLEDFKVGKDYHIQFKLKRKVFKLIRIL